MSRKKLAIWRSVKISGSTITEKLQSSVDNTGNMLFQRAVLRQLDYDLIVDGRLPDEAEAVDTLVMTLANFISPYNDFSHLAVHLEKSQLERIALIGIGAQSNFYDPSLHIPPSIMRVLKVASERSKSIGVRGYYTAELLNRRGIKNVDVIGCPSMFEHPSLAPIRHDAKLDMSRMSIHTTPSGNFRDCNSELFAFARRHGADYVLQNETQLHPLLPENSDIAISEDEEKRIRFFCEYYRKAGVSGQEIRDWLTSHARIFFDYDEWHTYMADRSFVIGSRFHGNMVPLHAGTPTLTLWFDSRTREMVEYLNLPGLPFEDFSSELDPRSYYELADPSALSTGYARKYSAYIDFLDKNNIRHHLQPASVAHYRHSFDRFTESKVAELPLHQRVLLHSACEYLASTTERPCTAQEFRDLFNRLRSSRDPDSCNLADRTSPERFPRPLPRLC